MKTSPFASSKCCVSYWLTGRKKTAAAATYKKSPSGGGGGTIGGGKTVNGIDTNVYNTVTIGIQAWMKENLYVLLP
ncbi:MAG: hypothetical protein HZA01_16715 [Nitrospinae bacterium]|nr:hypothetical protein [Nitrospinota bacterium]